MATRHQSGYIFRKGGVWYLRYYEPDAPGERRQCCRKLADYSDRYRCKSDVRSIAEEFLRPLNEGRFSPQSTLTVTEYVDSYFLPYAMGEHRPSTYAGYETLWNTYLSPRLNKITLRDFRCVDATFLLVEIHREHGLGRTTLKHIKSLLSAIFTYAKRQGVLDGANPIRDAGIPSKAAPPTETHAATPDEVLAILEKVGEKAKAAIALGFFAGLRPSEVRGARWEDYDGKRLMIRQAVWHTHTSEPKTSSSKHSVPVIEPLRSILSSLREADKNPASGPILHGPSGKPLNLDNLARRVIIPALQKADLQWHGWYSLRRGIATLVSSIEKDPLAAKGLLRHSSVTTTLEHYIKEVPEITQKAMKKIEVLCNPNATAPSG
jgi:integrase